MGKLRTGAVSVVVVNWNRRDLLKSALESLFLQDCAELDLIVVDNGSTDGSAEMVRQLAAEHPAIPLRLIENTGNRGFCAANNQGFAASDAEFVALLNNDAEADPDWLDQLLGGFEAGADVGMTASKILVYEDPARIDKAGHLIYLDGQNRGRGSGELDRGQYDRVEEVAWPDGCAAMYRREMLQEIGGFDEDLFAYADDAELGLRARIAGWKCIYVPRAVVRHHRGSTLGIQNPKRLELIERNRILLAAKLFPWSVLWLNGAYHLARLGAGMWAAARGRGEVRKFSGWKGKLSLATALLRGHCSAWIRLPKMLRKRRYLRRKLTSREVKDLLHRYRISLREISQQSI